MSIQFAVLEWLWEDNSIRVNLPGNEEKLYQGSYMELVEILNRLGKEGWTAVTCTAGTNWILWTLTRPEKPGIAPA